MAHQSKGVITFKRILPLLAAILSSGASLAQPCRDPGISHRSDIASTCAEMTMTMKQDVLDRPYLYVAGKESGLRIYDIADIAAPVLVRQIPISSFSDLHVMSLDQSGRFLYLALGNHFGAGQSAGIAIVDIDDPRAASVTDTWVLAGSTSGAGIVRVEAGLAYLGAMKSGLVILDVGDPADIRMSSQFMPDINYPTPDPNPNLYNARGMSVRDGIVYLCFDAGGLRIINAVNPDEPFESGRFSNPVLNGLPRAYNNVANMSLTGNLAYVAVDYCGVEVLDVSDTSNIRLVGWWNPYDCPGNNWFTSPVHANEIEYDPACQLLFVSTGKSDLYVLDASDPSRIDSCAVYGGVDNGVGSWGVSIHRDRIFVSYVCALIPFGSNWTGVKVLTYDNACATRAVESPSIERHSIAQRGGRLVVTSRQGSAQATATVVTLSDLMGRSVVVAHAAASVADISIDLADVASGAYVVTVESRGSTEREKIVVVR